MNNYRKSLLMSNGVILLFAILITFAIKYTLNPCLLDQQESLTQRLNLTIISTITDSQKLATSIPLEQLSYIKISNNELNSPLIYENPKLSPLAKILPLSLTTVVSKDGKQLIEFKASNLQLLDSATNILLIIYSSLLILSFTINYIYFRLYKSIESTLIQEIADESASHSPFTKVSEQLHEQKKLFHQSLQQQEKQIYQLAQQVNMDNLTGLNNRHAFRTELTAILSDDLEQKHAMLFIIRASELNTINSQRGFQHGDNYIVSIAEILNKMTGHLGDVSVYRVSGSDFALIAREMSVNDAQRIAKALKSKFDNYQNLNKLDSAAYSGISAIVSGQLPEQVLARTDVALAKAQIHGTNSWFFEEKDSDENQFGQQHWRELIKDVIDKRALMLLQQPIQAIHRNMNGYREVFTRFLGENNNMIPTDTIFAMAQRVDMIVKLEQLILETVISQCRHKTDGSTRWGVNLSGTAIQNSSFIVWLERLLLRESNIASCLIFEMEENVLDTNLVASKRVFDMLRRVGTRSAICKFGKGVGSFRLFKELKPDFVKIDASLINNIERDSANQQFVRMIIDVAHRMDCQVIAEGIEYTGQKQILESMYVDGIQGFLIARPSPF